MALVQSIPDDEIAAEIAASLPEDDRRRPGDPRSLREATELIRPTALAHEQTLPLDPSVAALLPRGLVRGSTMAVRDDAGSGATSLALLLGAGPVRAGSWVAVVGLPSLGLAAADELGVDLGRVAVIDRPESSSWATVMGALVGGFDLVLFGAPATVPPAEARRLVARSRERGSVLVHVDTGAARPSGRPPGQLGAQRAVATRSMQRMLDTDVVLRIVQSRWHGLGLGHGHLQQRHLVVEVAGRRQVRPRRHDLVLPGAGVVAGGVVGELPSRDGRVGGEPAFAGSDVDRLVDDTRTARHERIKRAASAPITSVPATRPSRSAAESWSDAG